MFGMSSHWVFEISSQDAVNIQSYHYGLSIDTQLGTNQKPSLISSPWSDIYTGQTTAIDFYNAPVGWRITNPETKWYISFDFNFQGGQFTNINDWANFQWFPPPSPVSVSFNTNCTVLETGCALYLDNGSPVPNGYYSDSVNCFYVVNGVIISPSYCVDSIENICARWDSVVDYVCIEGEQICDPYDPEDPASGQCYPGPDICYNVNTVVGVFDMWKMFLPGEVINIEESTARVESYTAQKTTALIADVSELPDGSIYGNILYKTADTGIIYKWIDDSWEQRSYGQDFITYAPAYPMWKLSFSTSMFLASIGDGNENPSYIQEANINPTLTMTLGGNIVTNIRTITLSHTSTYYSLSSASERVSLKNNCQSYRTNYLHNWKLTNNGTSIINWKAFYPFRYSSGSSQPDEIDGGTLMPGEWVGSSYYGGNKRCILANSLTYERYNGGVEEYSACV